MESVLESELGIISYESAEQTTCLFAHEARAYRVGGEEAEGPTSGAVPGTIRELKLFDQHDDLWFLDITSKNKTASAICGYVVCSITRLINRLWKPMMTLAEVQSLLGLLSEKSVIRAAVDEAMQFIQISRQAYVDSHPQSFLIDRDRESYIKDWVANFEISDFLRDNAGLPPQFPAERTSIPSRKLMKQIHEASELSPIFFFRLVGYGTKLAQNIKHEERIRVAEEKPLAEEGSRYCVESFGSSMPFIDPSALSDSQEDGTIVTTSLAQVQSPHAWSMMSPKTWKGTPFVQYMSQVLLKFAIDEDFSSPLSDEWMSDFATPCFAVDVGGHFTSCVVTVIQHPDGRREPTVLVLDSIPLVTNFSAVEHFHIIYDAFFRSRATGAASSPPQSSSDSQETLSSNREF